MKQILTVNLKTDYVLEILKDEDNHLAVKLSNQKGEFVGQLFSSIEGVEETVTRMSNGDYTMTKADSAKVKKTMSPKNESMEKLRRELMK